MTLKYTKWFRNIPKWFKNIPNVHILYQHLPLQDPTKITRIWIFGLKIYRLATLGET
jgi:hypothetical protein